MTPTLLEPVEIKGQELKPALELPKSQPPRKKFGLLTHAALFFVSLLVMLLVSEVLLRMLPLSMVKRIESHQKAGGQTEEIHPRGLYTIHPEIGWTLTPHFRGRFKKGDFDILVAANSLGLRDHEFAAKDENTFRILGLGDSFAFGWGVEVEEGFCKVLEQKLNRPSPSPLPIGERGRVRTYEVINAGIPGFGTYESLQLLKSIGLNYQPDLVLLSFYEGNDYKNNGAAPRKREFRNGYLADASSPEPLWIRFLAKQSILGGLVHAKLTHLDEKRSFRENVEKTKKILREIKTSLKEKGIPLVFIFIPDQEEAFYKRPPVLRLYDRILGGMTFRRARGELRSFCEKEGIYFYPLSHRFEDHPDAPGLRLKDTHWNAEGHKAAAGEASEFIKREILPQIFNPVKK